MHDEGPDPRQRTATSRLAPATYATTADTSALPPPAEVEALYGAETARTVRSRLDLTVLLLFLFVGISVVFEQRAHPERLGPLVLTYVVEVLVAVVAVTACRIPRLAPHTVAIAAAMASTLAVMNGVYIRRIGGDIDSLAMAQVCLMTGLAVMLPWGWRAQIAVCVAAVTGFFLAVAGPSVAAPEPWAVLGVWVGAITSCIGVVALDRYRRAAFVRATLLTHLSMLQRDEAEISGALAYVTQQLSQRVGHAGVLHAVNRLAVEILGCDWSSTLVPDEAGHSFHLVVDHGSSPAARDEVGSIDLPLPSMPLFARFRPGALVEIEDGTAQSLMPVELLQRWEMASALLIPVHRDAEIVAVIVAARRTRRGAFSDKQRRLALGIADAVAIALENERLISDLQEANRLKSDFVATMSHELRTPLNVILGYTEMLADQDRAGAAGVSLPLVRRIRGSAVNLLELVDATLDLARLEAGRDVIHEAPLELAALCAELADELEASRVKSKSALVWSDATAGTLVVSDRTKLKTILKNLIGNALKYTRDGRVEVDLALVGEHLEIAVRDDGVGIARESLPAIFEMFRQLESASTHPFGGVGLGLYIVKQLAERLGGSVQVESTVGVGSTFSVRIPARAGGRSDAERASIAS